MKLCFLAFAFLLSCLSAEAQSSSQPADPKPLAAEPATTKAEPAAVPRAAESRPAPEAFLRQWDELTVISRLIDRIEQETGLRSLRARADELTKSLRSQLPEGQAFDPERRAFVRPAEPAKPEAKPKP